MNARHPLTLARPGSSFPVFLLTLVGATLAWAAPAGDTGAGAAMGGEEVHGDHSKNEVELISGERMTVRHAEGRILNIEMEDGVDIEKIATFWQAAYRKEVSSELSESGRLSGRDICIINGHLDSLVAVMEAYATALATDFMGGAKDDMKTLLGRMEPHPALESKPRSGKVETPRRGKAALAYAHLKGISAFVSSETTTRKALSAFGEKYTVIPEDIRKGEVAWILHDTYEGMKRRQISFRVPKPGDLLENLKSMPEHKKAVAATLLSSMLIVAPVAIPMMEGWGVLELQKSNKRLNEKGLAPYAKLDLREDSRNLARLWTAATKIREPWSEDMGRALEELNMYVKRGTDEESLNMVREILAEVRPRWQTAKHLQHAVFFDFPLIMGYKATLADAYSAKGAGFLWFDKDTQMINAGVLLNDYAGTMHGSVVSPYTAKVYTKLVKFLKKHLSKKQFLELQDTCKLFATELELMGQ